MTAILEAFVSWLEWMQMRDRRQEIGVRPQLVAPRPLDAGVLLRIGQRTETGSGIVTGQRARTM